ncbi:MAG: prepilin-type N-terminal cleavage/methylation domain-containing protein [Ferrovibrionaceae bacterium]
MSRRCCRREAGMTLLEVLVVVVLVGMLATAAFEGLSRIFDLRQRLGAWIDLAGDNAITSSWLRDSLAGVVPEYENGPNPFRGSERSVRGLTIAGLRSRPGVPVPFEWRIAEGRQSALEYREGLDPSFRQYWQWEGQRGRFVYVAEDGKTYPTWPPEGVTLPTGAVIPQLPAAIEVEFGGPPLGRLVVFAGIITMRDADKLITPMGTPVQ